MYPYLKTKFKSVDLRTLTIITEQILVKEKISLMFVKAKQQKHQRWTSLDISLPAVTQVQHSGHSEYFQHIPLQSSAVTSAHLTVILKNNSQSHTGTAASLFGQKPSDFSACLDLYQTASQLAGPGDHRQLLTVYKISK